MIGHGGRRGKHAVGADEIRTQTQPLAGETDRLLVVSTDELAVRSNPIVDRGKGVPRAQAQRLAGCAIAFFPAAAIGECDAVIASGGLETGIELQRDLKFGEAVVEAAREQINARQRVMRPRVLAVGMYGSECGAFGGR